MASGLARDCSDPVGDMIDDTALASSRGIFISLPSVFSLAFAALSMTHKRRSQTRPGQCDQVSTRDRRNDAQCQMKTRTVEQPYRLRRFG